MQPDVCVFPLSEGDQVTAQTVVVGGSEKSPELTTANTVPPSEKEVNVSSVTKAALGEILNRHTP